MLRWWGRCHQCLLSHITLWGGLGFCAFLLCQLASCCVQAKSLQLCPTLCDPMDCSPPGSFVHEILQARTLEWIAMPSSRGSYHPWGSKPGLPHRLHCRRTLYHSASREAPAAAAAAAAAAAKSLQSCPTLCNPIDGSPPGSPVPGILQARTLEWVAISFSNA